MKHQEYEAYKAKMNKEKQMLKWQLAAQIVGAISVCAIGTYLLFNYLGII